MLTKSGTGTGNICKNTGKTAWPDYRLAPDKSRDSTIGLCVIVILTEVSILKSLIRELKEALKTPSILPMK